MRVCNLIGQSEHFSVGGIYSKQNTIRMVNKRYPIHMTSIYLTENIIPITDNDDIHN